MRFFTDLYSREADMNHTGKHILRTLLYFELFRHPLTEDELYLLSGGATSRPAFQEALQDLTANGLVRNESGYQFLSNGSVNISERIGKLNRARKIRKIAKGVSRLIGWHPFVRGVFISGSLSKSAFARKDDIDFFIITEPGRLWVCRAFLMIFKKIFLLNSKKYFCINYYIDSDSLAIPDHNLFTATELAFLLPMRNRALALRFYNANPWMLDFYPNCLYDLNDCPRLENPWPKRLAEAILKGPFGDRLDDRFMKIYRKRAERKFRKQDPERFDLNFRSEKNIAKHHPEGFQERILTAYNSLIARFELEHEVDLSL